MNIKARFTLTIWSTMALLFLGTIGAGIGIWQTKTAIHESINMDTLVINLYELRMLSLEYELYPSERAQKQWQLKYELISRSMAEIRNIPVEVSEAFVNVKKLYGRVISMDSDGAGTNLIQRRVKDQFFTTLHIETQRMIDWAFDISNDSRNSFFVRVRNYDIVTVAVLILISALTASVIFVTGNYILTAVTMLKKGTERIAHGELSHRIELPGTDEMSQLAGAFNSMSMDLQNSYTEIVESRKRMTEIIEFFPDATFVIDNDRRIIAWNKAIEEMTGFKHQAMLGKGNYEYSIPFYGERRPIFVDLVFGDSEEMERKYTAVRREEDILYGETYATNLARGSRYLSCTASALRDSSGVIVAAIECIRDITERKITETTLKLSEEKYRELVETANSVILTWDTKGNITFFNDYAEKFFGFLKGEVLGRNVVGTIVPMTESSGRNLERLMEEIRKTPDSFKDNENENITKAGRRVWVRWANRAIINEAGETVGILSVGNDITERKQAEEKVRQSEEFVRSILDTVDEGFIVIDRDFRILTANRAYCSQVGESGAAVIGSHCYEISHKKLRPCYEEGEECAVRHVFETGEPYTSLHKHPDTKGSILYVETKAFPIKDTNGAVTSVIETVNNISEKHLLEEERLKTQKLEAIGVLAGGIAHDFNNLLQGVFGYISMAKRMHDQKQKSLDMLEQAEKALHMSVNLTSQLLTFSKGGKPLTKRTALRPLIENSVKFALSGSRVDYKIQVDEELWMVEADEGQIGQVIQNLVLNAEQAMPMGGTITIKANKVSSSHNGLPALIQQGNYVVISIKDSGIGIPAQYLPKIFDPYFTTKDKGSGLGLATSYSIIKNHGGLIDVKSKLGEGTTFLFYLPAVETVETSAVTVSKNVQALRKGRVLLMDDEDIIRDIAGVMLRSLGHEVVLVENGEEAIRKYRESMRSGRHFDIVIMDLTIRGGMGGEEAIKELLEIDPDIKAIVSSGYTDSSAISEYKTTGFKSCLTKPYNIASLNAVLNSLLD